MRPSIVVSPASQERKIFGVLVATLTNEQRGVGCVRSYFRRVRWAETITAIYIYIYIDVYTHAPYTLRDGTNRNVVMWCNWLHLLHALSADWCGVI